ncbi:MAG: tetratricopeptide repeat protein [Bacteroidota bacterium]
MKYFIIILLICFASPLATFAQVAQSEAAKSAQEKGVALQKQKKYDEAIASYTEAIMLEPSYPDPYRSRGFVYYLYIKDYSKALADYNMLIKLTPNQSYSYSDRARLYNAMERYTDAANDYTEAIRLKPDHDTHYVDRAEVYVKANQRDLALADFNKYIALEPTEYAYWKRAVFYEKIKENELALKDFNKCIALEPKTSSPYYFRGQFYYKKQQYDLAVKDFSKAMAVEPGKAALYRGRGDIYTAAGNYAAAIADYETSIQVDTGRFVAKYAAYGSIISPLVRTGKFEEARKYAELAFDPNVIRYIENNPIKHFIDVVRIDLPSKQYLSALAKLDLANSEFGSSKIDEDIRKFRYSDILVLKGYVLEKLGRYAQAKEVYEQGLLINPTQPDVKDALAKLKETVITVLANDILSPEIQLISPQASRGLQVVAIGTNTEIIGKASDSSGIASVKVNGVPVTKIEDDGVFVSALVLKPGSNAIEITATDNKGNVAIKKFTVTGTAATPVVIAQKKEVEVIMPVVTEKQPVFHAILIATNDYEDPAIQDLQNPVKDATELEAILQTTYTFEKEHVTTLYNKSRDEIMQALIQKSSSMGANDNLLIFYAGHGTAEKDKFGDVDGYWIPSSAKKGVNSTYISSEDINKALKRSEARHVLVIADACFSGAFTRSLSDANIGIQKQYNVPSRKIMASGNMEPVPDNSKFIFYLKKNLTANTERYLTAKKLFDSFYEAILNNSDTSPQFAAIRNVGDEGGQFVFIKK